MSWEESVVDDPLLTIKDLTVDFESFDGIHKVIDGVSLSVGRGEVVAIAGETGCGKSVTMKAILRLLATADINGEMIYDGQDLQAMSDREFSMLKGREMSMIFQDPMSSLNPVFTIGEQLTDTAQFGGRGTTGVLEYLKRKYTGNGREEARQRAIDMLHEVQMPDPEDVMESYPTQLSGGMCQRVLIAQALLNEPTMLIADEPGTALDVTIHDQILTLLKRLIEERDLSLLMITHNLGVAREISDRVYIMYGGRIVETAPTEDIFAEPKHPYTQGLIASIPRLTGGEMAKGIDGSVPEYLNPPNGCRYHPRCPYAYERCRSERPPMVEQAATTAVECVLYDQPSDTAREIPTIERTRQAMDGHPEAPQPTMESETDD